MGHGAKSVPRIPPGFVVGAKAVLRAAADAARPVRTLIIAADAPAAATEPVRRLAAERALALVEVPSSEDLGRRCGLPRPVAAAAELRSA
ncbi:MAG TPA: ribosomal L7Ae/L30e/S12e/Gadd45 family protein [Mycobacteriales bacterium]|jgi:ribosomal protein L7Ae-like RNA K-turn-binding protein|nr:ribosomal L7Ae/L30e/S12e/Gadd45 family protein [Mycobacteriales bacterium]